MGQKMYVIINQAWPDYVKVGASCESPLYIGLREALPIRRRNSQIAATAVFLPMESNLPSVRF